MERKENVPQIKICGITSPDQARCCAELEADAIGLVFFEGSPRYVSEAAAKEICAAIEGRVRTVGVFVNPSYDEVIERVTKLGFSCIQLHGAESPGLVRRLRDHDLVVIKSLFCKRRPGFEVAGCYDASAYLAEGGCGEMPGGNALAWDWGSAGALAEHYPLILAGGLCCENIGVAVQSAVPDAVDVSSGVESAPGKKDRKKMELFIGKVRGIISSGAPTRKLKRIF